MFRTCPATGRLRCNFDKETHRCKCGRWERGYAPKKEMVKPRCECQICEGTYACDKDGTLGHHGYKRPGWGFIQGDCMGEGHLPYPATDALEKYLHRLDNHILLVTNNLATLPQRPELKYTYWVSGFGKNRKTETVLVQRGAKAVYGAHSIPSFKELEDAARRGYELELENAGRERDRVLARIAKAKAG